MRTGSSGGRSGGAGRGVSRFRVWLGFGAALVAGLSATGASALAVGAGTLVNPVYFNSGGQFGLNTGPAYTFAATSASDWLSVGSGQALSVQINLQTPVIQNPQDPSNSSNTSGPQATPSAAYPFVADSLWTVTNNTGTTLNNAYLVFEAVNLAKTTLVPGGYPDIPVGLDQNLISIVRYTYPGGSTPLFFGGISLGSLGAFGSAHDSTQIRVRYIVAGALPENGASLVMPQIEIAGLNNVPEPSTLVLLLGGGVALYAVAGRRRCA